MALDEFLAWFQQAPRPGFDLTGILYQSDREYNSIG
jgi:hypothetical protein